ncbi:MAG: 3-hydroxy-5-phosphonooxypentane-2,4-dione thiolase [Nocardioidaceae bacterium]|nr:3-hydroxy-5-phosphonooxypentane-2,4-dione thiolase [Nocardioidaceae bacterium]
MAQIIPPATGRAFFLAVDHGYFLGPTRMLEKPGETVKELTPIADALFATRGVLRNSIPASTKPNIILRISGGNSIVGPTLENETLVVDPEEAIRLGVQAVGVSIFVGTDYEKVTLTNLATAVNQYERYGIPVMAVTAVGKELEKRDARYLALSCRIAAELGARVVKTYWCEDFETITESCPAPVVIAGGPKTDDAREVFEFVHDGMSRGAIGVNLGRNIWQHYDPVGVAKGLRAIIHDDATPDEAVAMVAPPPAG